MASFPTSVKTYATRANGQTIQDTWFNDLGDEITAIEDGIINGTAPITSSRLTAASLTVVGNSTLAAVNAGNSTLANLSVTGGSTHGSVTISSGVTERGRSTPMGEWSTFTPNLVVSSGTWQFTGSTAAASFYTNAYTVIGRTLTWNFSYQGSTLSAANSSITVSLPSTFVPAMSVIAPVRLFEGGSDTLGIAILTIGSTRMAIQKSGGGAISSGTVTVAGSVTFAV